MPGVPDVPDDQVHGTYYKQMPDTCLIKFMVCLAKFLMCLKLFQCFVVNILQTVLLQEEVCVFCTFL